MQRLIFFYVCLIYFTISGQGQSMSWRDIVKKLQTERPRPDKIIAYDLDSLQFGELWLPAGQGPFPVVLLIHGGCWRADLPGTELLAFAAEDLKKQGFAVWNIEYRRVGHPGAGYPGTFRDVARAADYLTTLGRQYPLDLSQVIASGHSAGGHLALWTALRPNLPDTSPLYTAAPLKIHAVVSLAGIGNLKYFDHYGAPACGEETITQLIDRNHRGDAGYKDTSPAEMGLASAKFWLINGVYDAAVPPHVALNYSVQLKSTNQMAEIVLVQDAGHFEIIVPWTEAWKIVQSTFKKAIAWK